MKFVKNLVNFKVTVVIGTNLNAGEHTARVELLDMNGRTFDVHEIIAELPDDMISELASIDERAQILDIQITRGELRIKKDLLTLGYNVA